MTVRRAGARYMRAPGLAKALQNSSKWSPKKKALHKVSVGPLAPKSLAKGLTLLRSERCAKELVFFPDLIIKNGAEGAHLFGTLLLTFSLDEHMI